MSQVGRPGVTVVVPTRDRPDLLRACLAALHEAIGPDDEVLVVDSASEGAVEVARVVAESGFRLVREDVKGASRARNAGWRAADRDVVAFTDDDCLPQPGWTAALAAALVDGPAFAWGEVTVPEGRAGIAEHGADGAASAERGTDAGLLGPSCNLAVRLSALERVGGFDEALGPGTALRAAEDRDLQVRLLQDGARGVFAPEAVVEHDPWRPRAALVRLHRDYGVGNGALARKLELLGLPVGTTFANGLARTHLRAALHAARHGHKAGVVYGLARALGVRQGRRAAGGLRVVDGHLHR